MADEDILATAFHGGSFVVAEGSIKDFAAYEGPMDWGHSRIARNGNKISEEEARELFPHLFDEYTYRR